MKIKNILTPAVISVGLKSTTKAGVIGELLDLLVAAKLVTDRGKALAAVMEREQKMSTGIEHGVAIPHGKTDAVKGLAACIGISREGVDFASLDGQPSTIFIMTLSPVDRVGPHVQFLAEVSMVIKAEAARRKLLEAKSARDVLDVFGIQ